jgi:hypothetical protein
MLAAGLLALGVLRPERRTDTDLMRHVPKQGIRRWLPDREQGARIAKRAELNGEAQAVMCTAPLADDREITLAQAVVSDPFVFTDGDREEGGTLGGGKYGAAWHVRRFAGTGRGSRG